MKSKSHLIIVLGLPGTGKSTFAAALAEKTKAIHLNTDVIRDQLGLRGKYDDETKSLIYHEMLSRARMKLKENQDVIIDGTFSNNKWRKQFHELALEIPCIIRWIVIEADETVIRKRVSKKREYSEADFAIYKKVRDSYDPILYPHLVLPSDKGPIEEMTERVIYYLNRQDKNA